MNCYDPQILRECTAANGTTDAASWCRRKMCQAIDRVTSGQVEFDTYWEDFVVTETWRLLRDADGQPFTSAKAFCLAKRPNGLGMNDVQFAWLVSNEPCPPHAASGWASLTHGREGD